MISPASGGKTFLTSAVSDTLFLSIIHLKLKGRHGVCIVRVNRTGNVVGFTTAHQSSLPLRSDTPHRSIRCVYRPYSRLIPRAVKTRHGTFCCHPDRCCCCSRRHFASSLLWLVYADFEQHTIASPAAMAAAKSRERMRKPSAPLRYRLLRMTRSSASYVALL